MAAVIINVSIIVDTDETYKTKRKVMKLNNTPIDNSKDNSYSIVLGVAVMLLLTFLQFSGFLK